MIIYLLFDSCLLLTVTYLWLICMWFILCDPVVLLYLLLNVF